MPFEFEFTFTDLSLISLRVEREVQREVLPAGWAGRDDAFESPHLHYPAPHVHAVFSER